MSADASAVRSRWGSAAAAFVSRADVAAAAAGGLTSDGHAGATYHATAPASVTGAERAALVAEASGCERPRGVLAHQRLRIVERVREHVHALRQCSLHRATRRVAGHHPTLRSGQAPALRSSPRGFARVIGEPWTRG